MIFLVITANTITKLKLFHALSFDYNNFTITRVHESIKINTRNSKQKVISIIVRDLE